MVATLPCQGGGVVEGASREGMGGKNYEAPNVVTGSDSSPPGANPNVYSR